MSEPDQNEGIIYQLKNVLKEGLDYLNSYLALQQARFASVTLTSILIIIQLSFACLLGLTAFILLNIAAGLGLNKFLQNPALTISILGVVYALVALGVSWKAIKWIRNLKS